MKMLTALIIDDEPLAHKVILEYAKDIPFLEIAGQVYKATDAYAILQKEAIDLLFLDINMPKLKGLDFLRTLPKKPAVIITSAYEEYALEGFELQVSDYLLKPFRFDRFLQAVHHVHQQLAMVDSKAAPTSEAVESDKIFIKVDRRQIQLRITDILYLESYGNYVKVWTGSSFHLTPRTLSSFVPELPATFVRIHKSFIVQKACIDYIEGHQAVMTNGQRLAIGKNHRAAVKEWF